MTKNKKAEEIAFSRCDVPERTKRFALKYVSEAYAGIKNCRECEFYNTCDRIDSVRAELRKKKKEGMKNMTEQETRGKIFNIIREFNVKKRRYSTHTEPSDDDELADALIAAGIGDVSEYKHRADKAERALHILAKNALYSVMQSDGAFVKLCYGADTAKCNACNEKCSTDDVTDEMLAECLVTESLKQAEKELAEEGKDD